jgi:hypothetical protein
MLYEFLHTILFLVCSLLCFHLVAKKLSILVICVIYSNVSYTFLVVSLVVL